MSENFWETYGDEVIGEAEKVAAEELVRSQFGKLTASNRYFYFSGSPETGWGVEEIELAEYLERMKDKRLARSTRCEVIFQVDVQEMNPSLEWTWTRKVQVGDADWRKTLVPSVEEIYGKGSMGDGRRAETLGKLIGSYVEAHDVPQQPKRGDKHLNRETGEPYGTIRIARVFASKEECYQEYVKVFGKPESILPDFPETYGEIETWEMIKENDILPEMEEMLSKEMGENAIVALLSKKFGVAPGFIQEMLDEYVPV